MRLCSELTTGSAELQCADVLHALPPLDPAQARERLADLVRIYLEGQRHPLPLFPKTSFGYAQALRKSTARARPLKTARSQFEDNRNNPGEGSDRNVLRVFARAT